MNFERITMNLVGFQMREERLNGRDYLVVPTVALTEGVHTGDQGPLYYPGDEFGQNVWTWNHRPIVLDHPSLDGKGISACTPQVIENQGVGMIFNSDYDGRLKMESWLDKEKLNAIEPTVIPRLRQGETIEVSTGLFQTPENVPGTWNGESYKATARNIRPDHLAILTKDKGACSIADGAGLLRNAATPSTEISFDDIREQLRGLLRGNQGTSDYGYAYVADIYPKYAIYEKNDKNYKIGYKVKAGKVSLDGEPEEVRKLTSYVTSNGAVVIRNQDQQTITNSRREELQNALKVKHPQFTTLVDVQPSYVTFVQNSKQFGLPYHYDGGKVLLGSELREIKGESSVVTTNTTQVPGQGDPPADRKPIIDQLIAKGGWVEADRQFLESVTPDHWHKIARYAPQPTITAPVIPTTPVPVVSAPVIPVAMNAAAPMTDEQYLASLPPRMREMVTRNMARDQAYKNQLIAALTSNKANRFTPEFYATKEVPELEGLVAMLGGSTPTQTHNYSGQAEVPMFLATLPQQSTQNAESDPVLPMNSFSKESWKTKAS